MNDKIKFSPNVPIGYADSSRARLFLSLALNHPCQKNIRTSRNFEDRERDLHLKMPRQRSRKLSEGRKASQKSALGKVQEHEQDDSDNESAGFQEKDEEEAELDRLVLGDGVGFKAQLGQLQTDADSVVESAENDPVDAEHSDEADLENVDDEDVCSPPNSVAE